MHIGGQAVIEGVMMRDKENFAVAVRLPSGKIKVKQEKSSKLPKILTLPLIRGAIGLAYMKRWPACTDVEQQSAARKR